MSKLKDLLPTKVQDELERIIDLAKGIEKSYDSEESSLDSLDSESESKSETNSEEDRDAIARLIYGSPASQVFREAP